jgi:nicotinate-nucleotide adenylyltransferase
MTTALFGGTFNPIHNGHLIVAEHVRNALSIDTVIFTPSYITPHKQAGEERVSEHRLEMVRLAIHGNDRFRCSDMEIKKNEISYTIDTIEEMISQNPDDVWYLIIGMDNYLTFHHWKNPNSILSKVNVAVMNRPHHQKQLNETIGTKNIVFIDVPNIDISSTEIRKRVREGKSVRQMVPPAVDDYIRTNGLYK